MMFRVTLAILGALIASPAHACVMTNDMPPSDELRALSVLGEQIEKERELKSQIQASVWGVFLDPPSESLNQNGYSRFKVGGVLKGQPNGTIKVISNRQNVVPNTHIYYLNLRKINKQRWTDVGVTQQTHNWGEEACENDPGTARCKLHQLKQDQIKSLCYDFIWELYAGCLHTNSLPNICRQHIASAREALRVTPH